MEVNVLVEHGEEYVKGIDLDGLAKFVMGEMGLPECTDVTISFVTNERIHELNRDYRGIDRPTDVLSFESATTSPSKTRSLRASRNSSWAIPSSPPMLP